MIADRFRLDGRTVVVAGAGGGGIGTSVCLAAAELGADVTLVVDGGSIIRPSYLDAGDLPVFMEDGGIRQRLVQP